MNRFEIHLNRYIEILFDISNILQIKYYNIIEDL